MRANNRQQIDQLRPDDRILWDKVKSTTIPLSSTARLGGAIKDVPALFSMELAKQSNRQNIDEDCNRPLAYSPLSQIDRPTVRKMPRGRIAIEGRVDLHGLYRDAAYSLLLNFLQSAHHRGLRHVLVITGKGLSLGSEGILRRVVPHWLETAPFRQIVSSFDDAPRSHGGKGALYVRLRRLSKVS